MGHYGKNLVIALALLGAGFLIAWLRFRPYLGTEDTFTDGSRHYEALAPRSVRYALWDDPRLLGGDVNSPAREGRPALSPDGRYLVFEVGRAGLNADLWIARLVDGEPRDPEPLAAVNSGSDELAPAFGAGALFFASNRPGGAGGFDLWRAPFEDGVAGAPEPLGPGINTRVDDRDPAPLALHGAGAEALVFASNRRVDQRTGFDLYRARPGPGGAWEVEPLEVLNTAAHEREPAFAADGGTLVFASDREGSLGGYDLYRSVLDRGEWLPAEPLAGVNTAASERGPHPSRDGFSLLFAVEDEAGAGDLYSARSIELFARPGKPVGWLELLLLAALLVLALLAWLAKRWDTLEVVYKCFLVSLLLHLALLWWFRDIRPESGIVPLEGSDALFQVRLAPSRNDSLAGTRERGGAVELARESAPRPAASPERAGALPENAAPSSAPARSVARAEAAAASAPERGAAEHRRAEAPAPALREVARLEDSGPLLERRSAAAPELALAANSVEGRAELREAAAPAASPAQARASAAPERESRPSARSLDPLARRTSPAQEAPEGRASDAKVARRRSGMASGRRGADRRSPPPGLAHLRTGTD